MHTGFVPFNALGVLCAIGYAGYATTPSHIPWGGYVATVLFFIAAITPITLEYRRLNVGFRDIESSYLDNRRREHSPPKQEVIGPDGSAAQFRDKRSRSKPLLYLISALALILLLSDVTYRQMTRPVQIESSDHITNF